MLDDKDLIAVATFDTLSEAEMARNLLEAEGIEAVMQDRPLASLLPPVALANGGIVLLVAEDEADRAREVLATPDEMEGTGEPAAGEAAAPPDASGDAAT